MSTLIKLKYSLNTAIPSSLANQEPAWTANGDVLYVGSNGNIVAIAGKRVPGVLTANQAIVTNSTNMIDQIMWGNSTVNSISNSTAFALANSTVSLVITKPSAAQVSGGTFFLNANGSWTAPAGGASATGSNTQVQFNDSGSFGATAGFVFDKAANNLTVGNTIIAGAAAFSANSTLVNAAAINVVGRTNTATLFVTTSANVGSNVVANSTGVWVIGTVNATTISAGASTMNATTISTTDLNVSGNLSITGTLTTVDTTNLNVTDSIIKLARQNGANVLDIGFFGAYNDGTARFTGLVYDATTGRYELFANTTEEPTTTVNLAGTGYAIGTLRSYLVSGGLVVNSTAITGTANSTYNINFVANSLTLTTPLVGTSGGTGLSTIGSESILVGNTTNGFRNLTFVASKVLQSNGTAILFDDIDGGLF